MDPDLSAVIIGAELTRLGANCFGAEVQGHFLCVVDVAACVARTWHELGAMDLGAELGAVDLDPELGARVAGAELSVLTPTMIMMGGWDWEWEQQEQPWSPVQSSAPCSCM